jgi:hypothetical protein
MGHLAGQIRCLHWNCFVVLYNVEKYEVEIAVCLLTTGCFLRTMLEPSGDAFPPDYTGLCLGSFIDFSLNEFAFVIPFSAF